ncbi:MAG: hypothetical protein WAZ12_01605 [Candidatus Absconditicoccaceae bacterium]
MKKVYIAKRIPKQTRSEFILDVKKEMSSKEVFELYVNKIEILEKYIYNGPWVLRPPLAEDVFVLNNMPSKLTTSDIWNMVKEKITSSDIFIGIITNKAYGTIAEAGYACKCKNIAVYILPEVGLSDEEIQDLWLIFQIARETKHLWNDEDIKMLDIFSDFNIHSVEQYESYVSDITPNFMKKQ